MGRNQLFLSVKEESGVWQLRGRTDKMHTEKRLSVTLMAFFTQIDELDIFLWVFVLCPGGHTGTGGAVLWGGPMQTQSRGSGAKERAVWVCRREKSLPYLGAQPCLGPPSALPKNRIPSPDYFRRKTTSATWLVFFAFSAISLFCHLRLTFQMSCERLLWISHNKLM